MKGKNTEKSFFLKKYIFFIEMACIKFYVTLKKIFFKMLKQIKMLNRVVYVTLKRKTIRYSVLFIFLIKTWKFNENY